jgi:exosome complex component RRP4
MLLKYLCHVGDRDIISAEIQGCFSDGSVALHTRGSAYGPKLHGQRIQVLPALVKRGKQHFFDVKGVSEL